MSLGVAARRHEEELVKGGTAAKRQSWRRGDAGTSRPAPAINEVLLHLLSVGPGRLGAPSRDVGAGSKVRFAVALGMTRHRRSGDPRLWPSPVASRIARYRRALEPFREMLREVLLPRRSSG